MQKVFQALSLVMFALALSGCAPHLYLMPTPNLIHNTEQNPFQSVHESLQTPYIDVIFATDRFPQQERSKDPVSFGSERSNHLHVGNCRMTVGEGLTWEELVSASLSGKRGSKFELHMAEPDVLFRYPGTYWRAPRIDDPSENYEEFLVRRGRARVKLDRLLAPYLDRTNKKEVFLFVHGYNNNFNDSIRTIGNLWHFMGREGIPIAYTWPAGAGGLTGYTTDRESGEFTIFHFKMFLEDLAANPEIEKIHILAHSRGTDVTVTSIREIAIAERAAGRDPGETLKIGNLILASPDIDMEVAGQRIGSERIPAIPRRLTVYLSPNDKALKLSSFIQGSIARLGLMDVDTASTAQLATLSSFPNLNLIDNRAHTDFIGHGYFYNNPAVSSDVILLLRDNRDAGEENGRPLTNLAPNLWRIEDEYPNPPKKLIPFLPTLPFLE